LLFKKKGGYNGMWHIVIAGDKARAVSGTGAGVEAFFISGIKP